MAAFGYGSRISRENLGKSHALIKLLFPPSFEAHLFLFIQLQRVVSVMSILSLDISGNTMHVLPRVQVNHPNIIQTFLM
jgi:hypothetical protein